MNWRGMPRRVFPYLLVSAAGFLAAYLFVFFFAFPAQVIPDDARVPNVVGMTFERAASTLEKAGFSAVYGESRFHRTVTTGVVLQQDPPADSRQQRGIDIRLAISAGQRTGEVPQLAGLTEQQARIALANAGFDLGTVGRRTSDHPRGMVFASEPPAGAKLQLPSIVSLSISEGPAVVTLPDLTGRTLAEARSFIEQLGLRVGAVIRDTNSFQPENTVLRHSPGAGQLVQARGSVTLFVSRFPPAASIGLDSTLAPPP